MSSHIILFLYTLFVVLVAYGLSRLDYQQPVKTRRVPAAPNKVPTNHVSRLPSPTAVITTSSHLAISKHDARVNGLLVALATVYPLPVDSYHHVPAKSPLSDSSSGDSGGGSDGGGGGGD